MKTVWDFVEKFNPLFTDEEFAKKSKEKLDNLNNDSLSTLDELETMQWIIEVYQDAIEGCLKAVNTLQEISMPPIAPTSSKGGAAPFPLEHAIFLEQLPVNPRPFLNALTEGVKENGVEWFSTDKAKAIMLTLHLQMYGVLSNGWNEKEYARLKKVFKQ